MSKSVVNMAALTLHAIGGDCRNGKDGRQMLSLRHSAMSTTLSAEYLSERRS
jgi:hypothetical protein